MLAMKMIRERLGLTQTAVARELGVSRQTYNNWELGKRQADYEYLLRLGELFDTTVENILTGCLENAKPLTETQKRLAELAEAGDPSPQVRMLLSLPERAVPDPNSFQTLGVVDVTYEAPENKKSPRELATREDDLTDDDKKELELFAEFLRYRRSRQQGG